MKTFVYTLLIGCLFSVPVNADTTDVLDQLTVTGINFSYSSTGRSVNLLRTKETSEKVDKVVEALDAAGIRYTVTDYQFEE